MIRKEALSQKLIDKLYAELRAYRRKVMRKSKRKIYNEAYKIEMIASLYEAFCTQVGGFSERTIARLLEEPHILEQFYNAWLRAEDSSYSELLEFVWSEAKLYRSIKQAG